MVNRQEAFTRRHYFILADIVRTLPDEHRQACANHFATELRKKYERSFDPYQWEQATGGKVQGFDIRKGKFI